MKGQKLCDSGLQYLINLHNSNLAKSANFISQTVREARNDFCQCSIHILDGHIF